ncbi:MAG: CDP-alcohol phosphatidyltransferase family protein, partial [Nitrospinota bacterium]
NLLALARAGGVSRALVVTGYREGEVRRAVESARRLPLPVRFVLNPSWQEGNGRSLLAARADLEGEDRFLVLMADHVYEPGLIADFLQEAARSGGPELMAVETDPGRVRDLEDASKVRLRGQGAVEAVGKDLRAYEGVDCGLFLLSPAVFSHLEAACAAGQGSLSAGLQRLAWGQGLRVHPVGGRYWFDVDTPADLERAEREILARLPSPSDGPVSRHLNRRLSIPLSRMFSKMGVSPTILSGASAALAGLAGFLFAAGQPAWGGILAQAASVLDGCDGEVARLQGWEGRFGTFLDSLLDRLADGAILLGLGLYAYALAPRPATLALALLALLAAPLSMMAKDRFALAFGRPYPANVLDDPARWLMGGRDGRLFLIFLGGLLDLPRLALALVAVSSLGLFLWRLAAAARLREDLGDQPRSEAPSRERAPAERPSGGRPSSERP